ncbi:uncharacterized protein F4822DRAFT_428892 [Hypoxylon trugodes]|uniref:uncharacterized protein n=1 Tax=Hypoxylon trugodes TaxID=326681 RepID=UPI00218EE284|nr:uncharacterized protein F4822DRAFT_428892 [Hypoxylon trugodes]KAI1388271.1 hypothetical protein F4822DRAFT_428892 [Hypoxylon trugodes]
MDSTGPSKARIIDSIDPPSHTMNLPSLKNDVIHCNSSTTSDDDEVIVYDKFKAESARKGTMATMNKSAEKAPLKETEHNTRNDQAQMPDHSDNGNNGDHGLTHSGPEAAYVFDSEWRDTVNQMSPSLSFNNYPQETSESSSYIRSSSRSEESFTTTALKEELRWYKIYYNMTRNGMIKSPFVPSTFEQYLSLRIETVKAKERAFYKQWESSERDAMLARHPDDDSDTSGQQPTPVEFSEKLAQVCNNDGLTCVNARHSIWGKKKLESGNTCIDWPSARAYQMSQGWLPQPRLQKLDVEHYGYALFEGVPIEGPGVPYELRKPAYWAIRPVNDGMYQGEAAYLGAKTQELRMQDIHDLNETTYQLLLDIDADEESAV